VPVPIGRVESDTAARAENLLSVEQALEIRLDARRLTLFLNSIAGIAVI
jgi:hypothetical protein